MSNLKKLSTLFMAVLFTFAFAQDVTLTFGDVDLDGGTMEIYMVNTVPVAGFQLMMDNVDLLGAGGGSAAAAGFITNTNASGLVLGFSLSGATIPVGEGVLTVLTVGGLLNPDGQACIASATLSDSNGGPLTAEYSDCWPFMEPQLEAPTNLMAVGGDGEIMLSWDHEASRDVVDLSISNYDAEAGQLAIYMANTELVGGFQFELDASFPDFLVTSVSGGTAAAAGFIMNSNAGGLVLGFSLSGATIPVGEGVLCYVGVSFTGEDGNFSIATATMSDAGGGPLSTTIGGPYYIGEIPEVITYNVYRDGGLFMEGLDMMSYTDMGLAYSEAHCYTVTAFNGTEESDHSNEACAAADALLGCMDPDAVNYNPEATEDDGSCIYVEAPTNLMAVGGDGEIMLSWDHEASRDVVDLSISNYDAEAGQLAIYMANTELVGGFQFELDASFPDFLVTSVSGGTAAAAGFIMNSNAGGLVLGFSLSGATIPVGEGVLCYVGVSFTGEDGNFSIATATMSDAGGGPLSTTIGGPYYIGEIPEVITYNIYRDGGLFMEGLDMMSYTDMGLGYSETHCYTVTAFDGENESAHSNEACATTNPSPEDLYAPFGLTAEGGINYVDLAWIDGAPVEAQWISYDNGVNNDGIGVDGAADFDVAIRFDTSQIAPFAGGQLTEVRFFPREELCEYAVRVWIGGSAFNAGTMVLDQAVTNPVIGDWNNVVLDVPVDIEPGMELWFGYRANTQAGFPAGCDAGPATPGYSDLILFGGAWVSMAQAYSLNYNWNIQGYVSNGGREAGILTPIADVDRINTDADLVAGNLENTDEGYTPFELNTGFDSDFNMWNDITRDFLGYNVYRDGSFLDFVSTLTYRDMDVMGGTEYCYMVSAEYDGGESEASNEACATPDVLLPNPPQNLTANGSNGLVSLAWDAPEEEVDPGDGFEEGFEGGALPADWMNIDDDGDGQLWFAYTPEPHTGTYSMASASWFNGVVLYPDNYLVTPALDVTADSELIWYIAGQDPAYSQDHVGVFVSTTGMDPADFTTEVDSYTPAAGDVSWHERTVDLSEFAGESIYIAFRHYNSVDIFYIKIDDISVSNLAGGALFSSGFETEEEIAQFTVRHGAADLPIRVEGELSQDEIDMVIAEYYETHPGNQVMTREVTGYALYRSEMQGGPYTYLAQTDAGTLMYDDTDVENGTQYFYVATAWHDAVIESDYSNEASATPLDLGPLPPYGLTAVPGDGFIDLTWNAPADNVQQELQYWDGPLATAFYFYDTFENGFAHGTRFDVGAPLTVLSASAKILSAGDPFWPWPNATHGPVRVLVMDDNGGQPGNVLYDGETTAVDGWATINPNLTGIDGTFYVIVTHDGNWQTTGDAEGFAIDDGVDNPNNMYTMQSGVWSTGDVLAYGGDYMFSALVSAPPGLLALSSTDPIHNFVDVDPDAVAHAHIGEIASPVGTEEGPYAGLTVTRDLEGYVIYRDGSVLTAVGPGELTYHDEPLTNGQEYCYEITAQYTEGESIPTAEVCATPMELMPNPPVNLVAEDGPGMVSVSWDEPDPTFDPGAFNEGFEGGDTPADWMNIDDDGDGQSWFGYNISPNSGTYCMASASWINGVILYPDNYLVTPALDVTGNSELTWNIAAQDPAYAQDHVGVFVSTTGSNPGDFTTEVDSFTPPAGSDSWYERTVDLSAFAGETVYIAFRHYNSVDMFYIKVDDITVTNLAGGALFASGFETEEEIAQFTVRHSGPELPLRIEGELSENEINQIIADYMETHPGNEITVNRDITGYNLYRGVTEGGPYDLLVNLTPDMLMYDDTDVEIGTTYYYVATAVYDDEEESMYSNEDSGTPFDPIIPPANLVAYVTPGVEEVNLEWVAPEYGGGGGGEYPPCPDPEFEYEDCSGLCFNNADCVETWGYPCLDGLGDGFCDDGAFGIDFNCADWDFDLGDCGADNNSENPMKAYVEISEPGMIREELTGYNVYRTLDPGAALEDFDYLASTVEVFYLDTDVEFDITYYYYVTAVYDDVTESAPSNTAEATPIDPAYPPQNLTAVAGDSYIDIAWNAPAEPEWISYDDGINNDGIGTGAAADFDVAIRFEAADLEQYFGGYLTQVRFFPREAACDYSIRVWIGGSAYNSGVMVVDQPVNNVVNEDWNTVTLNSPVMIEPGQELWFGYRAITSTGYPAGCDAGPALVGYSDLILFGGAWVSMTEAYSLDYNWNLQGLVSPGVTMAGNDLIPIQAPDRPANAGDVIAGGLESSDDTPDYTLMPAIDGSEVNVWREFNRELNSYNIYRDGGYFENVPSYITSYHDEGLNNYQEYCYQVTAVYDAGESNPTNEACAMPTTEVALSLTEYTEVQAGEQVIVTVSMDNAEPVGGIQFDLADMPEYLTLQAVAGTARIPGDWALNAIEQGDGQGRVLGFSFTGTLIAAGTGAIMELTFMADPIAEPMMVSLCTTDEVISNAGGDGFLASSGCGDVMINVLSIDVSFDHVMDPVDQGGTVDLTVYVNNPLPFYGMELHISDMPEAVTAVNVEPTDRFPEQAMFSFSELDGELTVLWFSLSLNPVDVGTGELFTITYEVGEDAPNGTTEISMVANSVFSDLVGNAMYWNATEGSIEVGLPDVMLSLVQTGDGTFEVHMANNGPVSGFQIDIADLPDYYTFSAAEATERVPGDWLVNGSEFNDAFRLIGFSLTGSQIPAGEGAFLNITADYLDMDFTSELCFSHAVISDPGAEGYFTVSECADFMVPFEPVDQHFDVSIDPTGEWSLVIIEAVGDGIQPGDEIGLFDGAGLLSDGTCDDEYGELLVGAGTWMGSQLELNGIGSLDYCDFGGYQFPGYVEDNSILFKIWKAAEQMEYIATAEFSQGNGTWGQLITAVTLDIVTTVTQEIHLNAFQNNMFSLNVHPDDPAVATHFGENIFIAYNDGGQFYVPSYGLDQIDEFETFEGYVAFPAGPNPVDMMIDGMPVDPGECFTITQFVKNMIPYLPNVEIPTADVFAPYNNSILIVSNDQGQFYVPSMGVNTMPVMAHGKGYEVFLSGPNAIEFCYPAPGLAMNSQVSAIRDFNEASASQQYSPVVTGLPHAIVITDMDGNVSAGDELVAYADGLVVGATRILDPSQPVVIAAWEGFSRYGVDLPGFNADDAIELRLFSSEENRELRVEADLDNWHYGDAPLTSGSVTVSNMDAVPTSFTLNQNYPNPFNPTTSINFSVDHQSHVNLTVYDLTGRQVKTLVSAQVVQGYYSVIWDGTDSMNNPVSAGMYIYTLQSDDNRITRKMVLMK